MWEDLSSLSPRLAIAFSSLKLGVADDRILAYNGSYRYSNGEPMGQCISLISCWCYIYIRPYHIMRRTVHMYAYMINAPCPHAVSSPALDIDFFPPDTCIQILAI